MCFSLTQYGEVNLFQLWIFGQTAKGISKLHPGFLLLNLSIYDFHIFKSFASHAGSTPAEDGGATVTPPNVQKLIYKTSFGKSLEIDEGYAIVYQTTNVS